MKMGINTLLWTAAFDRGPLSLLTRIRSWGFDGVEIARFNFADFPALEIRRGLAENGLQPIFCSALTGQTSLISGNAKVRKQARDFLVSGIECAASIGAKVFCGPFVSPVGQLLGRRRTAEEWNWAIEGLTSLGDALDANDVTLAVEPLNRFECYALNTAEDAACLIDAVGHPRIGVLFDTFHANIEEKSIAAAVDRLGSRIKHVHTCENDRGIPGSGHVDWKGLFAALTRCGYDGWHVIESFGSNIPEIAAAACVWRDLAPDSELIASEGLQFLRRMTHRKGSAALGI
jgi:D-psicose/D-tagatose/L-ribulose 3-epimerase